MADSNSGAPSVMTKLRPSPAATPAALSGTMMCTKNTMPAAMRSGLPEKIIGGTSIQVGRKVQPRA